VTLPAGERMDLALLAMEYGTRLQNISQAGVRGPDHFRTVVVSAELFHQLAKVLTDHPCMDEPKETSYGD